MHIGYERVFGRSLGGLLRRLYVRVLWPVASVYLITRPWTLATNDVIGAALAQASSPNHIGKGTMPRSDVSEHQRVSLYFWSVGLPSRFNFGSYGASGLRLYGRSSASLAVVYARAIRWSRTGTGAGYARICYSPLNAGDERRHRCCFSSSKLTDSYMERYHAQE